jgi:hypothetical protein
MLRLKYNSHISHWRCTHPALSLLAAAGAGRLSCCWVLSATGLRLMCGVWAASLLSCWRRSRCSQVGGAYNPCLIHYITLDAAHNQGFRSGANSRLVSRCWQRSRCSQVGGACCLCRRLVFALKHHTAAAASCCVCCHVGHRSRSSQTGSSSHPLLLLLQAMISRSSCTACSACRLQAGAHAPDVLRVCLHGGAAGNNESQQLECIFKLMGAPSEQNWPGVSQLEL